ncbi:PREDICTED: ejaculatory bulb-specific protein 3-like [Eufriesea mexicana]|uniref:ejaculatory bulb-specific protein 3-like n=1 Tax=Eufriesea mexicana TaxID=516756 RepID=UPI00083C569C|nr:PREDICTED: ejaculatory bulb-specific protein 3-like [Eufriesea mexicana]
MKVQIFFLFTIVIFTSYIKAQNISNLVKDRQYVQKQINCILNLGHCDSIGRKIKELLPEAVNNRCQRCTPRQATHARTLIAFMQQNYPYEWHLILQHYAAIQHYTN